MSRRDIIVSVDLAGQAHRVGVLHLGIVRGREAATFRYDDAWLAASHRFALSPALTLDGGGFQPLASQPLHGALSDSAPDRWGRTLMQREERRRARVEGRTPRALMESDYLLGVHDVVRQGALRFQLEAEGAFVAPTTAANIPPMLELPRLLAATQQLETDSETDTDEALALILAPGSSLGGARPKAAVRATDGSLWIAKFAKSDDSYSVESWEAVALSLAKAAGIETPLFELVEVAATRALLVQRFDRRAAERIPYLSAMSLLNAVDGVPRSYVEIAEELRQHGAQAKADLAQLWRRLVFTIAISNLDDHLRNHGFLYAGPSGWRLSPVFDLNPVPADLRPRVLSTSVDVDGDPSASIELAMASHEQFLISSAEAGAIRDQVEVAVREWRRVAMRYGIGRAEIERMASAFGA